MRLKSLVKPIENLVLVSTAIVLAGSGASAGETFHYELIEERNNVHFSDTGIHWIAGLMGSLRFEVGDDGSVTTQKFDVRFDGTFRNVSGETDPPPFEPGDLLTDFLQIDFSTSNGIAPKPTPLQIDPSPHFDPDAPLPRKVYVGPDVRAEPPIILFLGLDYLNLSHLGRPEGFFWLTARGDDPLGGDFRLLPPGSGPGPGPDGTEPNILIFTPNVRLIPEPTSAVLVLLAAGVAVWWRHRRGPPAQT